MRWVGSPPSTGLPASSCGNLDSYTPDEREGLQGIDRAVTTGRLPLKQRKRNVSAYSLVPEHHVHLQGNYPHPPRTPALWIDKHRTRAYL
jgi:hypothetical protein